MSAESAGVGRGGGPTYGYFVLYRERVYPLVLTVDSAQEQPVLHRAVVFILGQGSWKVWVSCLCSGNED